MSDQISRVKMTAIQASVIGVKGLRGQQMGNSYDENIDDDFDLGLGFRLCQEMKLRDGDYQILFAHPETLTAEREIPNR